MVEISKITDVLNHISGLKAVLFDLDDTLYGEKEYVRSGYKAVAKLLPNVVDAEEKLWVAFENKEPAIDTVLNAERIYSEELKAECILAYRNQIPDIHLYDGVLDMLIELRSKGMRIGIITDGRPEGQKAKIKALNLEATVEHIIITDELGGVEYRKPCEKALVIMREYFGVTYQEMCYVGDNIVKDFIAPEKLGLSAIWFRNRDGLYYQ